MLGLPRKRTNFQKKKTCPAFSHAAERGEVKNRRGKEGNGPDGRRRGIEGRRRTRGVKLLAQPTCTSEGRKGFLTQKDCLRGKKEGKGLKVSIVSTW